MKAMRCILCACICVVLASRALAGEVSVAAAANFGFVLKPLNKAFEREHPGTSVRSEIGASGSLVAQIYNGAPYDVFLSADMEFPKKLVEEGAAKKESLAVFAFGKLVLWTVRSDLTLVSIEDTVRNGSVHRIAIANWTTAPYGRSALEALSALKLLEIAEPKFVIGENVAQTSQFVSSGGADIGFVALSLVMAPEMKSRGSWMAVPTVLYRPLAHGLVLTNRGYGNPACAAYIAFLGSPTAKEVLNRYGYGTP